MADITVSSSGFSPNPYPTSGSVQQGDKVMFRSATDSGATFYAQSGLFFWPPGSQSGNKNTGTDVFTAPSKSAAKPLSCYIAPNPPKGQTDSYKLSLSSISADKDGSNKKDDSGDGTINVGSKSMYDSVTDSPVLPRPHHAPGLAMRDQGSD